MERKELTSINPFKYSYLFGYREQYLDPEGKADQLKEWRELYEKIAEQTEEPLEHVSADEVEILSDEELDRIAADLFDMTLEEFRAYKEESERKSEEKND